MTEPENQKPVAEELLEHEDLGQAVQFFREYGRSILLGVVGALLVVGGVAYVQSRRQGREADAAALLAAARTPEQLESVRDRYAGTRMAAMASLRLGGEMGRAGKWTEALAEFESFGRLHKDHILAPVAEYNIALCLESLNRLDEASRAYTAFETAHPDHFLRPQAMLGRARCEAMADRPEAARAIYEEFLVTFPQSRWTAQAESALLDLKGAGHGS